MAVSETPWRSGRIRSFALILASLSGFISGPAFAECKGRTVDDAAVLHSPVCVADHPQRIITLDPTYTLGMALDLGLPIIGAPLFGVQDPGLQARASAAGVTDIGHANEPSIETIIGLQPDLILGDAVMHAQAHDLAARIAPTVLIGARNWKQHFATIAAATGATGKADAAFAAYDRRVADIRKRMPYITVSIVRIVPDGFQVYLDGPSAYAPFSVLADVGVKRSAYETTTDDAFLKRPDWETLSALDGDVLLYIVGGSYDVDDGAKLEAETTANPLWQMLPAVKAGRAHRVDVPTWMAFGGLTSASKVLDDVERFVIAAP